MSALTLSVLRVNANIKYAIGYVQETVGSVLGNEQMQAEGATKQPQADAEYEAAQAQGYAQGAGEKLKGNVKDTVGSAIGNEHMQAEGKASATRGEARLNFNSD
ncbi:DNA binding protein [Basidiobolus meristosporus CBS 931.73]|uniref:DNA binding protein n=1 Tax=Basidiobolus meristosporus CBS 931.73 TaxID=1314790 RepID=A0A1Y1Y1U6_9FUNG|nr:DNA binding protein [Basidiobolus meristosporus CBS 931.73]|eukprot:ORX91919.1 DNA binding protein [Basidiobolus meristosporus CBS 931.73]